MRTNFTKAAPRKVRPSLVLSVAILRVVLAAMAATAPHLAPDPRSQCARYSGATYEKMRDDDERTGAYQRTITQHAPGRVCLDIGTGSLAVLAVQAAQAGAAHVYAVEANAEAAEAARRAVVEAGVGDRVTVIDGYSTDVLLPSRVDLVIHEIFGEVAGSEGVTAVFTDALARHLAPKASQRPFSVPAFARSMIAPAEFPPPAYFDSLPFPMIAAPGARALKLPALPRELLLSAAAPFEELSFGGTPDASQATVLDFVAQRDGDLGGLAVHIEIFMEEPSASAANGAHQRERRDDEMAAVGGGGCDPDVSSARRGSHWPNVFLMLPEPASVSRGQRVVVRTTAELGGPQPKYHFEVLLAEAGAANLTTLGRLEYPENV